MLTFQQIFTELDAAAILHTKRRNKHYQFFLNTSVQEVIKKNTTGVLYCSIEHF